jgi:hypothetical protein
METNSLSVTKIVGKHIIYKFGVKFIIKEANGIRSTVETAYCDHS